MNTRDKPTDAELRARLTAEQYHVTQEKGTERAFTGQYAYHKDKGVYSCVVCGNELFSSDQKYDSGSGWPSFWLPLAGDHVRTRVDRSHGMNRTEVECANCGCAAAGSVEPAGAWPSSLAPQAATSIRIAAPAVRFFMVSRLFGESGRSQRTASGSCVVHSFLRKPSDAELMQ